MRTILELHDDSQVVDEATDGFQCLDMVDRLDPDVVLMDIRMPGLDGIETTRRLTRQRIAHAHMRAHHLRH